jgi:rhodanese-related sulfurtransferase
MSAIAAQALLDIGYSHVYNLTAGLKEWQAAGYELLDKGR